MFVCVGVFDGLHLGHAYLLRHLVAEAAARSARPVVITFDHHPDEILTGNAPPLLCDPDERLARLEAAGVDTTVVVHFDRRLRETPYEAFVAAIADRAPIAGFLMTPDAAFGYERAGTPDALAALGREQGFDVVVVPPYEVDGAAVRSSEIRAAIARRRPGSRHDAPRPPARRRRARPARKGNGPWSASRCRSRCRRTAATRARSRRTGGPARRRTSPSGAAPSCSRGASDGRPSG